jgi:hypothetical protein
MKECDNSKIHISSNFILSIGQTTDTKKLWNILKQDIIIARSPHLLLYLLLTLLVLKWEGDLTGGKKHV